MASQIEGLADELILEILSHLRPQRKHDRDPADSYTHYMKSGSNLHSLCLTSRRLSAVATPVLYCDAITADSSKCEPTRLPQLLRTILHNPCLGHQIKYVEYELAEYETWDDPLSRRYYDSLAWRQHCRSLAAVASGIWAGDKLTIWSKIIDSCPYVAQMTLLLQLASNVREIAIEICSEAATSFIDLMSFDTGEQFHKQRTTNHHGFLQLERIFISVCEGFSGMGVPTTFSQLVRFFQSFPSLRHCLFQGLSCTQDEHEKLSELLSFHKVETLNLQGLDTTLDLAASIINSCGKLRQLTLHAFAHSYHHDFNTLHSTLLAKKDTLEHIELLVDREGNWFGIDPLAGSLAGLQCLNSLRISEVVLMGIPNGCTTMHGRHMQNWAAAPAWTEDTYNWTTFQPAHRLSALVPTSLKVLYLDGTFTHLSDNTTFLWDFIDDLNLLPQLRVFGTRSDSQGPFDRLCQEFANRGIEFRTT